MLSITGSLVPGSAIGDPVGGGGDFTFGRPILVVDFLRPFLQTHTPGEWLVGIGLRISHRCMVGCVGCRQVLEERMVGCLADPGLLSIPVVVVGIISKHGAVRITEMQKALRLSTGIVGNRFGLFIKTMNNA